MGYEEEEEQLSLFERGVDLKKVREIRDGLTTGLRSRGTRKAYRCDWNQFQRWCADSGKRSLPATEDTVNLYITWLMTCHGRRAATGARHAAAIAAHHKDAGHPNPVTPKVREAITAVRRERTERPVGKRALTPEDLAAAVRACDPNTNRGARDRALLVFGFASLLRRSELGRLQLADITFVEGKGILAFIERSKTDQERRGREIPVWPGKNPLTDPVRMLRRWIEKRGNTPGPLFCRVQTGDTVTNLPITGDAICDLVRGAIKRGGQDSAPYGAHSLRAGAVTASAEIGRSDQEIMAASGHKSQRSMQMYVRHARAFSGRNPLEGAL